MKYKYPIIIIIILIAVITTGIFLISNYRTNKLQQEISFYEQHFFNEQRTMNNEQMPQMFNNQQAPELKKHGDTYQAQNESFVVKLPAKSYEEPVEFERKGKKLQIISNNPVIKTAKANQQANYLYYKNVFQSTDIIKKITSNGVKEAIIIKSDGAPAEFKYILNVDKNIQVKKESDGDIRFYEPRGNKVIVDGLGQDGPDNFLFRIPAPYMIDVNKQISLDAHWIFQPTADHPQGGKKQYELILVYNSQGLTYPFAIDPSVTDTFDDENKISALSSTTITGGQAKLTVTSAAEVDYMEYTSDANAQSNYVTDSLDDIIENFETGDGVYVLGDSSDIEYRPGQSFQLSSSEAVIQAAFHITDKLGSPTGNITLTIETDSAGWPSGTLADANATKTQAPVVGDWNIFTFPASFTLSSSTTYWIVVRCDNQSTGAYWRPTIETGGGYADGKNVYERDGAWDYDQGWDMRFRIYSYSLQSYSESDIKQQGTYSLRVVATASDSLNDDVTRSVSPTIDLSGVDTLKFDVRASRSGTNFDIAIADSGGTVSSKSVNITTADTWETTTWDISGVADADKDVIDTITIEITNADDNNIIYIDNFLAIAQYPSSGTVTSDNLLSSASFDEADYMEYSTDALATAAYVTSTTGADIEADYMEYTSDANAQSNYVSSDTDTESTLINQTTANDTQFHGDYDNTEYRAAQEFVLNNTTTISKIAVSFNSNSGSPSGTVTARIETNSGGLPSGTLAHSNATKAITPTASAWNDFDFTDFELSDGTYHVVLTADNQSTGVRWNIDIGTPNPYSGGSLEESQDGGVTWSGAAGDMTFRVYELLDALQVYSDDINQQGSYSLKIIASGSASLNDDVTRSVSPTIDLSDVGTLKFDVRASRSGTNFDVTIEDSGGTLTSQSVNITASDSWQTETWDISGVSNANKDAIASISVEITNADADNIIYVDNFFAPEVLQSYSEDTSQQGSYSLMASASATFSLNESLTRTVSPTIDFSNRNEIKFDVKASRSGTNFDVVIGDSGGNKASKSVNITSADTWQTETWDISGISNANKDAIDTIIIEITNADADNIIYIDNMFGAIDTTTIIDMFYYNASSLSAGTEVEFQFSQDNSNWYSASGSADWSMGSVGSNSMDLADLGWDGNNFYYKMQFNSGSDDLSSPVVDEISIGYNVTTPVRLRNIRLRNIRLK